MNLPDLETQLWAMFALAVLLWLVILVIGILFVLKLRRRYDVPAEAQDKDFQEWLWREDEGRDKENREEDR